jgi:hypothetical protein
VGEGKTSLSLDGSFLSLFQMAVPQGKEPGARPIMAAEAEWDPQRLPPASTEGVPGFEVVGDMELLAKEPFRGRGTCWDVSLSHEARRTGLWGGCMFVWAVSGIRDSASSSELARASESGVNVLASFSRRMAWLEGGTDVNPEWPIFDGVPGFATAELILSKGPLSENSRSSDSYDVGVWSIIGVGGSACMQGERIKPTPAWVCSKARNVTNSSRTSRFLTTAPKNEYARG